MHFIFTLMGYFPDLIGGAWMYASGLAEALASRGHRVDVIVPKDRKELSDQETLNGVHIYRLNRPSDNMPFMKKWNHDNRSVKEFLREHISDPRKAIIINHQAYLSPAFSSWQSPNSATIYHGPWDQEYLLSKNYALANPINRLKLKAFSTILKKAERKGLINSQQVFTASEYAGSRMIQSHPNIEKPQSVIGAGTDYQRFAPLSDSERDSYRHKLGIQKDEFLISTVRRLDKRMGLDLMVKAFQAVAAKNPKVQLLIAGKGEQKSELQELITKLELNQQVRLHGFVPDEELASFYAASDLTIMPSLDLEGFGLSTIESLGCGTPVLGSSSGANPEVITNLSKELIFRSGDIKDLSNKILEILSNKSKLPSREECRTYSIQNFSWSNASQIVEKCFENIIEGDTCLK